MDYSFLTNLTLVDTRRQRTPKERNPSGVSVRIFANGEVYPSKELTEKYNLEFTSRVENEEYMVGNGIDVVDSIEWTPLTTQPRMILFGITPKTEAKVDLFASCRFNDDNTPKSSVLTQGATSETLLNLVRNMGYLTDDQKYVDLVLLEQFPIKTQDGISNIPKVVERGVHKGEKTYERRENVVFFPVTTSEEFESIKNTTEVITTSETEVNPTPHI